MSEQAPYCRRNLELRAAAYYASIRKPESEWTSIEDLGPQLLEFEHRVHAEDYDAANKVIDSIDYHYLYRLGYYTQILNLRKGLLKHLKSHASRIYNLGRLGSTLRRLGEIKRAIDYFNSAIAIARETDNRREEGIWLRRLGSTYRGIGKIGLAFKYYELALVIAREMSNAYEESILLGGLGKSNQEVGNIEEAVKFYEQAVDIACKFDMRRSGANWRGFLGTAYRNSGKIGRAIELYEFALNFARKSNHHRDQIIWLDNLAGIYCSIDEFEKAIKLYEEALALSRKASSPEESYQLLGLGRAFLHKGKPSIAQKYCQEALKIDEPNNQYQAATVLGISLLHQGSLFAKDIFAQSILYCQEMLEKTENLYAPQYILATALVGQAVCDPYWADPTQRATLLAPALAEYHRALEITIAPGVVGDAIRDLELIRAAGIEGLEPVFELLEGALTSRPK